MNKSLEIYNQALTSIGCVICREETGEIVPAEIHHIAEGSGLRSDWMVAPLCISHHRIGSTSLHGAGVKQFLRMYKLPTEYHLMGLVNKFRTRDRI